MTKQMIRDVRPEKVIALMCEILELTETSEEKVVIAVHTMGLPEFFRNIELLDVEDEEKEKMRALKNIIEEKAKTISMQGGH